MIKNYSNTVSVIVPIFNESLNVNELNNRLVKVLNKYQEYEIIYVDDGSTDDTLKKINKLANLNEYIKVVSLSRNFGHQVALSAGIDFISKDTAILMDGDLQDPPEIIPSFIEKINKNYNVVYGVRKSRKENIIKRISYYFFYRFLKLISNINIPLDSGEFSALDKTAIHYLKKFPEKNKYIRGIRSWIGFNQTSHEYNRDLRFKGKAKYNIFSLFKLAFDGIISFSNLPLKLASMAGFIITSLCILYMIFIFCHKIFVGDVPQGWSSLMVVILFLGGIQLLFLGIVGEYIARIYDEVRGRPSYLIKETKNIVFDK